MIGLLESDYPRDIIERQINERLKQRLFKMWWESRDEWYLGGLCTLQTLSWMPKVLPYRLAYFKVCTKEPRIVNLHPETFEMFQQAAFGYRVYEGPEQVEFRAECPHSTYVTDSSIPRNTCVIQDGNGDVHKFAVVE